nr:hypothetical protein [Neobacillus sp. Marseille-Q6967]
MGKEVSIPFLDDFLVEYPVKDDKEAIQNLLTDWANLKENLHIMYEKRDQKNTLQGMKRGIVLFIQFLFWTNDHPVKKNEPIQLSGLEIKPVNLDERLSFILSRPNLFHSYRQLSELMMEQEKLYAKKTIVKKRLTPKG